MTFLSDVDLLCGVTQLLRNTRADLCELQASSSARCTNAARRIAKYFGYDHSSEKWFNRSQRAGNRLTTLLYRASPQNGILTNAKKPIGVQGIVGKRYIRSRRRLIRTITQTARP